MLQNFGGGGATFRCFITAYRPQLNPYGPETYPGGRPGPWGACYVLRRYMPFSVDGKGLTNDICRRPASVRPPKSGGGIGSQSSRGEDYGVRVWWPSRRSTAT